MIAQSMYPAIASASASRPRHSRPAPTGIEHLAQVMNVHAARDVVAASVLVRRDVGLAHVKGHAEVGDEGGLWVEVCGCGRKNVAMRMQDGREEGRSSGRQKAVCSYASTDSQQG